MARIFSNMWLSFSVDSTVGVVGGVGVPATCGWTGTTAGVFDLDGAPPLLLALLMVFPLGLGSGRGVSEDEAEL